VLARECFILKTQPRALWITSDTASQKERERLDIASSLKLYKYLKGELAEWHAKAF